MTVPLYLSDPYMTEFDAIVLRSDGDEVVLDRTAFYPGGGGQDPDAGTIGGLAVKEVRKGGDVVHVVPGNAFKAGDSVRCAVDRVRRLDLMRGHTAEHLLFSRLKAASPGIELVKIAITPDRKSLVVKGELTMAQAAQANGEALRAIFDDLPVTEDEVARDELEDVRAKLDRISADVVRVVSIGALDRSACAGVHVASTGEIGMLLITRLASAGKGQLEVEFEVGDKAKATAASMAHVAQAASAAAGAQVPDLPSAVSNLKDARERAEASLNAYAARAFRDLTPSDVNGVKLYSGLLEGAGRKAAMDAAAELAASGAACVLATTGGGLSMVIACHPSLPVDCADALARAMRAVNGRGGGKRAFATGGAPTDDKADEAMVAAMAAVRDALGG